MAVAVPRPVRHAVDRLLRPEWLLLGVVALPFALGLSVPAWAEYLPLLVSILVLGLPHGAVDHLVPARVDSGTSVRRSVVLVSGLYALLGGIYLLGWFLAPVAAFAFFILLTWAHWGQGDLYCLHVLSDGRYPTTPVHRLLTVAVRGALPMLVPLVAFPGAYESVLAATVGLFGADPATVAWAFTPGTRIAVAVGFAVLVTGSLVLGARSPDPATWKRDATEVGLLSFFFAVVPPVLAIGVYFCVWHSLRHIVRVVGLDEPSVAALARGDLVGAVRGFARDATPTTAISLVVLAGLAITVPQTPAGLIGLVAIYLVLLAVLTLPHVVVVTLLDRRQGVW
ncbi:Brp/Blh family beta-carotene 15,15'-dioxygenase [Haloarchaeobius sp. HME9146]|uniref:Brp/Blh family beta-carotene 15,15'-dioxygenase n=1 Tax=Haloarchaeobius sp. HME9146 TaxID=2978732 RepID=UPI0021C14315|nr:Brp/Blh family beta-carotene 15,15'-dioxygenase [Haloarchaeobius sp. HME9146]MCT9094812.1 Brp/Blh family beta-carotene 15,15'-dioxygenase [Haloarchaeobius sp. HME9146]